MHWFPWVALLLLLVGGGCAARRPSGTSPQSSATNSPPAVAGTNAPSLIVTPGSVVGKVALVNAGGRYVIIGYPPGAVPPPNQRLNVYRGGLKVAELKVTGPQRDLNTVADILAGECQPGDDVAED